MKKAIIFLELCVLVFLTSCAQSYSSISPSKVQYAQVQVRDTSVVMQYQYEVLREAENKKNAKKEVKFGVHLVAVKITNNTDSNISINDLEFLSGDKKIIPLTPEMTRKWLRQKGEYHLFYLLLTPMRFYNGPTSAPIGLVIGPGLTLLNMGVANAANKNMMKNLRKYSLLNKEIGPRTSLYGLAAFPCRRGDPLYVRWKRN